MGTMTASSSLEVMASLKDFQRRTVEHVHNRLYLASDSTHRFLVADEVGMGKTLVARGVIAKAVEHLEGDDSVDRIDIIYICSNSAIARQNLQKLNIFGKDSKHPNTRITMLAAQDHDLNEKTPGRKTINLIAFTPGTSFEKGQRGGKKEERALIFVMLKHLFPGRERQLSKALALGINKDSWKYYIDQYSKPGKIDSDIRRRFLVEIEKPGILSLLQGLVADFDGRGVTSEALKKRARKVIGVLRTSLARASVDALEPDLIILDEFQRFKHLLEVPTEDTDDSDIRRLAQQLFSYQGVRTLLLSATPYKLFTMLGEEEVSGDDHYKDFLATTRFLVKENEEIVAEIEGSFKAYREALMHGENVDERRKDAQRHLVRVMSRTERPTIGESGMGHELQEALLPPTADELAGFVAMDRLAQDLETSIHIDYWKSAPYFLNFMDGYKAGRTFKEAYEDERFVSVPQHAQVISPSQIKNRETIEPGNARLRSLQSQLLDDGLWKFLWLPPSLPYLALDGPYKGIDIAKTTKRLIFSSWSAAPNSIASLLSHEVATRIFSNLETGKNSSDQTQRLTYRKGDGQAKGMTTFALFTPITELAELTDILVHVREANGAVLPASHVLDLVKQKIGPLIDEMTDKKAGPRSEAWYWVAPFLLMKNRSTLEMISSLEETDDDEVEDDSGGRQQSIETAIAAGELSLGQPPGDLHEWVVMLGMFAPGNIAYRSLKRTTMKLEPSEETLIRAAAIIGEGFRSLFNRPESMSLIDLIYSDSSDDYWRRVLRYCMDGDLQAVVDEYLHHLVGNSGLKNDEDILDLAKSVSEAMSLKTAAINLFNPRRPEKNIPVNTRFAVRFGTAKGGSKSDEKTESRMSAVQQAFNSPFWPMVLASTSVGQEGVDFHWWCHSLVHWNLPSNPVDIEQREGRIHRFTGHAVRKNVAAKYRQAIADSSDPNPWAAMFDAAVEDRDEETTKAMGDLWPWWVFPGESKIVTWTPVLPFSKDGQREERMRRWRVMYRLAFGQPRQEDLMMILNEKAETFTSLDLRPPLNL
jgi:hypothetical protein